MKTIIQILVTTTLALSLSSAVIAVETHRAFWRGLWVDYVEVNGNAVTEGDIIIGPINEVREWTRSVERGELQRASSQKALTLDTLSELWSIRDASGVVVIPYTTTTKDLPNIQVAIDEVNRALAGVVRWIPRTAETDYVDFNLTEKDGGSCRSWVGRRGGKQEILGDPECVVRTLVHEMGHAMGLWHIQQDARAAAFVDIRLPNMDAAYRSNNQPIFGTRTYGGYDYDSNMHYSRTAFSASSADRQTLETKPQGITVGTSTSYSPADLDGLFRIYGKAPTRTTLYTNPPGLSIVVDGVDVTTPATFDWPIGSIHRIWVKPATQTKDGFSFAFGRWSHDAATEPSPQLTWQVRAGDGALGAPTNAPADTVITANFVRLIDVQTTASVQVGGNSTVVASRAPWPGTASLYPIFTRFDLTAQPNAGYSHYFVWGSANVSRGGAAIRNTLSALLASGLPSQTIGAQFHSGAMIAVDAVGVGLEDGITVKVTAPDGSSGTSIAPRIARNTQGGWKFEMDSPQFAGASIRYIRDQYVGFDDASTASISMPSSGTRNVSIRAHREVKPYKRVQPSCAGSISLSDTSEWLRTGSPITVSLSPTGSGVFTGWTGTLSGTSTVNVSTVGNSVPDYTATFNRISEPLTIATVAPSLLGNDETSTTITIRGTGFTTSSVVFIDDRSQPTTYVNSNMLRATVQRVALPAGRLPVYVGQSLSSTCAAYTSSLALDVLPAGVKATVTMTEFYNAEFDYYFMSSDEAEKNILNGFPAWRRTGVEFKLFAYPADGALPLERFFFANAARNGARGTHFYTSIAAEQSFLTTFNPTNQPLKALPNLEAVVGYTVQKNSDGSCPNSTIPVYRAFRAAPRYMDDANHRFSTSLTQHRDMVDRLGWTDESIVFCAL